MVQVDKIGFLGHLDPEIPIFTERQGFIETAAELDYFAAEKNCVNGDVVMAKQPDWIERVIVNFF